MSNTKLKKIYYQKLGKFITITIGGAIGGGIFAAFMAWAPAIVLSLLIPNFHGSEDIWTRWVTICVIGGIAWTWWKELNKNK